MERAGGLGGRARPKPTSLPSPNQAATHPSSHIPAAGSERQVKAIRAAHIALQTAETRSANGADLAGVGIGLVFPTVATEVMTSVPGPQIGVASGTNSALRELGGVFGVAVLA